MRGRNHRNISVILITQNPFHQGRFCRYLIKCPLYSGIKNLAHQVYPEGVCITLNWTRLNDQMATSSWMWHKLRMTARGFEPTYSRQTILIPSSTLIQVMKRVKSNYHTLHVLKTAEPRLRKPIISNCNKELVNCISEIVFNVLNGNIRLSGCNTRKVQKHKAALRKVVDRHMSLWQEQTHCTARRISLESIKCRPTDYR